MTGRVLWITGLSGAGKTTMSRILAKRLRAAGEVAILLDGDELRAILGAIDTHSRSDRLALAFRYAALCRTLADQGVTVIIATISLFNEIHRWNRAHLPGYTEIYLKVPLAELRRRDPKGLYRQFAAGEITNIAGLDLPIDEPHSPDLLLEPDSSQNAEMLVDQVLAFLSRSR